MKSIINIDYIDKDWGGVPNQSQPRLWYAGDIKEQREGGEFELVDFKPYLYYKILDYEGENFDLDRVRAIIYKYARRVGAYIVEIELVDRFDYDQPCKALKITCNNTRSVTKLRDLGWELGGQLDIEPREFDLPYPYRYTIDNQINLIDQENFNPKILALDLEMLAPEERLATADKDPIIISIISTEGGTTVLSAEPKDEKKLIEDTILQIKSENPDIICHFNGNNFDWPYLVERAKKYGIKVDLGRDGSEIKIVRGGGDRFNTICVGRALVDLYELAVRDLKEITEKGLKNICFELGIVGEGERELIEGNKIGEAWNKDRERLLKYAYDDGWTTLALARKLLPSQYALSNSTRMPLHDVCHAGRGRLAELYLIGEAVSRGIIYPNKRVVREEESEEEDEEETYKGAIVIEPPTGLIKDIRTIDFGGMYPNIILNNNISPESLCTDKICKKEHHTIPEVGHKFHKSPLGFVPSSIKKLIESRRPLKAKLEFMEKNSPEWLVAFCSQFASKEITNCFSGDTEIVTVNGLKNIKEFKEGDLVYSINPSNLRIEVKPIIKIIKQNYTGNLYEIRNYHMNFNITSNHKLFVDRIDKPYDIKRSLFIEAKDLVKYGRYQIPNGILNDSGKYTKEFKIPFETFLSSKSKIIHDLICGGIKKRNELASILKCTGKNIQFHVNKLIELGLVEILGRDGQDEVLSPCKKDGLIQYGNKHSKIQSVYDMNDWIKLCAWYISEGSITKVNRKEYENGNVRGESYGTTISQSESANKEYKQEINELLIKMGFKFYEDDKGFKVSNRILYEWLELNCGRGSRNKKIPDFIFDLSIQQREIFFNTLMKGDGNKNSNRYTTTSLTLRNQLIGLLAGIGYKPMYSHENDVWRIYFSNNKGSFKPKNNLKTTYVENKDVYCVTVEDNHTIMAGRNGKFQWCGQSVYGFTGWKVARWFNEACAESTTAVGRDLILKVIAEAKSRGIETAYSDTDSCFMYDHPLIPDFIKIMEEEVGIKLDVEALYKKIFFYGAKKRYAAIDEKGKLKLRGFEVRRGDWCVVAKKTQKRIIENILMGDNLEEDIKKSVKYVQEVVKSIEGGIINREELVLRKGLSKMPGKYKNKQPHVEALKRENLDHETVRNMLGQKIPYIVLNEPKEGTVTEQTKMANLARDSDWNKLNKQYYIDNQVVTVAMRILETFGISEQELKGQPYQIKLEV